nr:hypothetical protein GCM10020093_081880 [Planobispora longispora]
MAARNLTELATAHPASAVAARYPHGRRPRPEFRADLRERLMNTPRENSSPRRRFRPPQTADPSQTSGPTKAAPPLFPQILSMGLVTVMVAAGMATYESVPGDTLYPSNAPPRTPSSR